MDQLICATISHTHYWYEVGMLKVRNCVTSGKLETGPMAFGGVVDRHGRTQTAVGGK